ncbi:MAG: MFS transporter [Deltaproteobacteria bacterium]|nr:MAG: MFS transporter [Deltaproteobacteria bacterium]TMA72228.1 MAG: MFS transporter [Deltaproteobacteria bacterium]TMB32840.1 MAG: MFS transporter [Deltaproteobacteria bacterium]
MAAMEMTVVSTAMPTVVGDLGGIHFYSWVFTAYLLTSTVTVPLYGKLADLYGRKPVLLFGIGVFLVGSMASGLARGIGTLIAFRAVQGLGAGAMQPTTLTIVGDIYNLEERSRMQGVFGAVWGVAGLVGPLLGGIIVKYLSWRWVFFINVPAGIAAAAVLMIALHEDVSHRQHSLDWAGAGLLTVGLSALLFGAQGGSASAIGLPVAAVLLALFVIVERRAVEPVLPLGLFRQPVIGVATLAGALVGAGMISMVTYVPLYVQGVLGGSPTEAGSAITPMVIGWPIASAISGRALPRVGYRPLIRSGLAISAAAAVAVALLLRPGASLHVPQTMSALFGVGLGFANTALLIAVQTSVEWRQRGVATASTMFARTIGGTLAVGALGAILSAALVSDPSLPPGAADRLLGPEHGAGLAPTVVRALANSLQGGLETVFWAIAGISIVAAITSLFFPRLAIGAQSRDHADIGQPAEMSTLPPDA